MKIKEVSALTGLTKKTIRFYEEAGLIEPAKHKLNGREFRDYSEGDLERLREIAVLRKARFTIEETRMLQREPEGVQEIFTDYYDRMKSEKREMDRLMLVLEQISQRTFASKGELIQEFAEAADSMSLPVADIHPNFRYLDELEEKLSRGKKKEKPGNTKLKNTAAMTQSFSLVQTTTKPGVRDGSMNGTSVIMAMRMMDDE